jgi:protein tyrosine/serine phosphatase
MMIRNLLYFSLFVVAFAALNVPGQTAPSAISNVNIRNFGQMDTNYFRGAQPAAEDFQALKALGITTVIDLQKKPTSYEKATVESLGMKYINIPMRDDEYPNEVSIATFLRNVTDPANGKVYVHCKGGRHRTGVTGAVYRFTKYGWDYDKVMKEMENYNFDTSFGRNAMKQFVIDYARKMKDSGGTTATPAANSN